MVIDEKAVFVAALALPDAKERAAYLQEACSGDPESLGRLRELLSAHEESQGPLDRRPAGLGVTVDAARTEGPGTIIGPYKLLQHIGEGGMGVVWMAEQTQPVQRKVALKVIKPGMDSRQVIARFEAERQALAMMDHVNIARVIDGGATEAGRPYFVMELVHGVPITKYCDDNHLTPRERLELFVPVCQAIQHAHQKGIIHRDIKPSNIMVTLYDGKPVPKVIDFGVAKATEQKLTERTLFTQYGTMVGTLEYMSPEQAEMSALGVDTRSDIYSLGVLLYELLTGNTPLTHMGMKEVAYAEILRMIREVEPPKPSTRLSDSGEALASISANRHMEPAKLTKLVRGELDWIVMKTLEKDRNRRYETANAFAADVQRYLADEPVLACPPTRWYRFGKFARRNKAALSTALLVAVALVVTFVVLVVSNVRINHEKDQKDDALLAKEEALREKQEALKLAQKHLQHATSLTGGHSDLANALRSSGTPQEMERNYRNLLVFWEKLTADFPDNHEYRWQLARHYSNLGDVLEETGQFSKAVVEHRRAAVVYEKLIPARPFAGPDASEYARAWGEVHQDLGDMLRAAGQHKEAEGVYRKTLGIWNMLQEDRPKGPWRWNMARAHLRLGRLLAESDRSGEAQTEYGKALAEFEKQDRNYLDTILYAEDLARAHVARGDLAWASGKQEEARKAYRQVIVALEAPRTNGQGQLAWFLATCLDPQVRDPRRAAAWAKKSVEGGPQNKSSWKTLGVASYRDGDYKAAVTALEKSMALRHGGDSFDWFFLAMAHEQLSNREAAQKWYSQAVKRMQANNSRDEELRRLRAEAVALLKVNEKQD